MADAEYQEMDEARAALEPAAFLAVRHITGIDDAATASIAISLKRIADALEKQGGKSEFERVFGSRFK